MVKIGDFDLGGLFPVPKDREKSDAMFGAFLLIVAVQAGLASSLGFFAAGFTVQVAIGLLTMIGIAWVVVGALGYLMGPQSEKQRAEALVMHLVEALRRGVANGELEARVEDAIDDLRAGVSVQVGGIWKDPQQIEDLIQKYAPLYKEVEFERVRAIRKEREQERERQAQVEKDAARRRALAGAEANAMTFVRRDPEAKKILDEVEDVMKRPLPPLKKREQA